MSKVLKVLSKINSNDTVRYKRIYDLVNQQIRPLIDQIKRAKDTKRMPYKEIKVILDILYPDTKHRDVGKGYFKHVFIIHTKRRWLALKIGRSIRDMRKDAITYEKIPANVRNRYFAKIYWTSGLFMLQKYGEKAKAPKDEIKRLKEIGNKYGLKDIREANIMKVGGKFKIVDAERR